MDFKVHYETLWYLLWCIIYSLHWMFPFTAQIHSDVCKCHYGMCCCVYSLCIDKTQRWRWGTWERLSLLNERPWAGERWPTQISLICKEASAERLWSDSAPRLQTDTETWATLTWEWHRRTEEGENEITGVEWRDGCWGMNQLELHI